MIKDEGTQGAVEEMQLSPFNKLKMVPFFKLKQFISSLFLTKSKEKIYFVYERN